MQSSKELFLIDRKHFKLFQTRLMTCTLKHQQTVIAGHEFTKNGVFTFIYRFSMSKPVIVNYSSLRFKFIKLFTARKLKDSLKTIIDHMAIRRDSLTAWSRFTYQTVTQN